MAGKAFDSRLPLWQATASWISADLRDYNAQARMGHEAHLPDDRKRFYDLNRSPIVSPYTGEIVDIEIARRKMAAAVIARVVPEKDDDVL